MDRERCLSRGVVGNVPKMRVGYKGRGRVGRACFLLVYCGTMVKFDRTLTIIMGGSGDV